MPLQFIAKADSTQIYVFIAVVVIMLIVFIIGGLRSGSRTSGRKRHSGSFKRQARRAGLTKPQIRLLERALKDQGVPEPSRIFSNGTYFTKILGTIIRDIRISEHPDDLKEAIISDFFTIKRIVSYSESESPGPSSRTLTIGHPVTVQLLESAPFASSVVKNTQDHLGVELPRDKKPRMKRGDAIVIRAGRDSGKAWVLTTNIAGIAVKDDQHMIICEHRRTMRNVQSRTSPRISLHCPAFFQHVEIVVERKAHRAVKKAVVQRNQRMFGSIENISAGGCAIDTSSPLPRGSLVKIVFDLEKRSPVTAFGKVLYLHAESGKHTTMHIAFTRVAKADLNRIQSHVFGLSGPDADK